MDAKENFLCNYYKHLKKRTLDYLKSTCTSLDKFSMYPRYSFGLSSFTYWGEKRGKKEATLFLLHNQKKKAEDIM